MAAFGRKPAHPQCEHGSHSLRPPLPFPCPSPALPPVSFDPPPRHPLLLTSCALNAHAPGFTIAEG
eukprot:5127846-Prorocentrum_lima.AAC.1